LRVAVDLCASDGFDVPLNKVAERAEVGRATLYRNFPDRESLVAAVVQVYLDDLATKVAQWGSHPDAFLLGLRALAQLTIASGAFGKITSLEHQAPSISQSFRKGVEKLMTEPLALAKTAGLVRADFDVSDVHLAALMVAGGGLDSRSSPKLRIDRALQLLVRGIGLPA
jgi:AcrR family transcriptional regulator